MTALSIKTLIQALKSFYPADKDFIALHEPEFKGHEWDYVKDCLDTGWVSSVGQYVTDFEKKLAELTGMKHAVAVVNGTAALHACLKILNVSQEDEVLLPSLTFVATANAVSYCNATPHFIDSEARTLGIDCEKLADYLDKIAVIDNEHCYNKHTGKRIKAIIPMHTFGHPVRMDALKAICDKYYIDIIEDAAESLGSFYQSRHTGHWGKLTAVSFNGNKIVTTGGGGAILTNDEQMARNVRHITTTAKVAHPWRFIHDQTGFNFRLPNLNAALGLAQLEQLENRIRLKRALAAAYAGLFDDIQGLSFVKEPEMAESNYWLNAILLDNPGQRDELLQETNDSGIMTRPFWDPMHKLSMYEHCPKMDLNQTEDLFSRLVNIPSSAWLGEPYA